MSFHGLEELAVIDSAWRPQPGGVVCSGGRRSRYETTSLESEPRIGQSGQVPTDKSRLALREQTSRRASSRGGVSLRTELVEQRLDRGGHGQRENRPRRSEQ